MPHHTLPPFNDTTFSKAADPEVDLAKEVAYAVKEVETPVNGVNNV